MSSPVALVLDARRNTGGVSGAFTSSAASAPSAQGAGGAMPCSVAPASASTPASSSNLRSSSASIPNGSSCPVLRSVSHTVTAGRVPRYPQERPIGRLRDDLAALFLLALLVMLTIAATAGAGAYRGD